MKLFLSYGSLLLLISFVASLSASPVNSFIKLSASTGESLAKQTAKMSYKKLAASAGAGLLAGTAVAVPMIVGRDENEGKLYARGKPIEVAFKKGSQILTAGADGAYSLSRAGINAAAKGLTGSWTKPILIGAGSGALVGAGAAAMASKRDNGEPELHKRLAPSAFGKAVEAAGHKITKPGVFKPILAGALGASVVAIPVAAAVGSQRSSMREASGMTNNLPFNQGMM